MKIGDLVIVSNSGGKFAILLKPLKKGDLIGASSNRLTSDGWKIWWPEGADEFISLEEEWLIPLEVVYENV